MKLAQIFAAFTLVSAPLLIAAVQDPEPPQCCVPRVLTYPMCDSVPCLTNPTCGATVDCPVWAGGDCRDCEQEECNCSSAEVALPMGHRYGCDVDQAGCVAPKKRCKVHEYLDPCQTTGSTSDCTGATCEK